MGLDAVELIMDVETAFNVHIANPEANSVRTLQDLFQIVLKEVGLAGSKACVTARAFRLLRQAFVTTGIERRSIKPNTPIRALTFGRKKRRFWRDLQSSTGLQFPRLEPSSKVTAVFLLSGLLLGLCVGDGIVDRLLCAALFLVASALALYATRPLARWPARCSTVGDLAKSVASRNYARLAQPSPTPSGAELWELFRHVIAKALSVKETELAPDTRFIEDLNVG